MIHKLSIQFVTDEAGNKQAVLIPIKEWEQLQQEIRELLQYRALKNSLSNAFLQVQEIQQGRLPKTTLSSFLHEG